MGRIVATPAVSERNVQKSVGSELQVASVVIRKRLDDESITVWPTQVDTGRGSGHDRIGHRPQVPGNDRVPVSLPRVVDEEAAARRVVRRERQTQQTAFAATEDQRRQVEKIDRQQRAVADNANLSALFDHELHVGLCGVLHHRNGSTEPGYD